MSFSIVLLQLHGFSKQQVYGSCIMLFILESLFFTFCYFINSRDADKINIKISGKRDSVFSFPRLILDATILGVSFIIINYLRRKSFTFSEDYVLIAYIITGLWFVISIFTRKFEKSELNIWYMISPYIKTLILITLCLTAIIVFITSNHFSRFELFGTMVVFSVMELFSFSLLSIKDSFDSSEKEIKSINILPNKNNQAELSFGTSSTNNISSAKILKDNYLVNNPELYHLISKTIDIYSMNEKSIIALNTQSLYNILHLKTVTKNLSMFINLHRVNDIRRLNKYFILLYQKINNGGYIVGCMETLNQYAIRYKKKMPNYLAKLLYIPNFIFRRVFPKLSILKQLYFFITNGNNLALSKAEVFGRLQFCGFSVIAEQTIDSHLYFIARKVKTISIDQSPSYKLFIKLPRIGLNGKIIHIYKLRTMYPYSEYLQEYIYLQSQLNATGKFNNDFRMSVWGKMLRKLWIDELPQLLNWIQGDISLVGVRALSEHYFSLYPKILQESRIQFKPGLVPPYYADMPENFEEIVASELRYLKRKSLKPITTDLYYFKKAIFNIAFKGARSG